MPLLTTEEFDFEVSRRVASDTKLAAYIGTIHGTADQGVSQKAPNYASYGTLIDLVNSESVTAAAYRLDVSKNSKLIIYSSAGAMVITNPRAIKFNNCSLSVSGEMLIVDISADVLWWLEAGVVTSQGELPQNWFCTGLIVGVGTVSLIAASIAVINSIQVIGRRARLG